MSMAEVLVEHQRQNSSRCLCDWSELGKSHPAHQAQMLEAAGFGQTQALAEQVRAALRLISPDDITPMGARILEKVLDAHTKHTD